MMPSNAASKIISEISNSRGMAKSKTGSFWLTETVELAAATGAGGRATGTLDLGAYVDVGDQQAIAVESVDFIWQVGPDYGSDIASMLVGHGSLGAQLTDLNPSGVFVRADDNSLVGSGTINGDATTSSVYEGTDFYPDNFGKLDEARMIVNDSLYITVGNDNTAINAWTVYCTARIKCRIVKLGTKDWMSIAIQSTASDN